MDDCPTCAPEMSRLRAANMTLTASVDSLAAPGERQIRVHDLRASGASTADEHGARATAIRDAMGHSRLKATETYLRSGQAANARAAPDVMTAAVRRPAIRAPRGQKNGNRKNSKIFLDSKARK